MQKVLVAPLDWGLGHATRCIPVIRSLRSAGAEVLIAATGYQKAILAEHFHDAAFTDIPRYDIQYPAKGSMAMSMLGQSFRMMHIIRMEHQWLEDLIRKEGITHVISDNRYGLWSTRVKTAFITHQIHIQAPQLIRQILFWLNKGFIRKFNELWIPDEPQSLLSGELSSHLPPDLNGRFVGTLSRFNRPSTGTQKIYDVVALLSGPEPQRSILENLLYEAFADSEKKLLIIRGLPGDKTSLNSTRNIICKNSVSDEELKNLLHKETLLICRPGYSTLMDLAALHHENAVFIPTPGQTEQEYLAKHWKQSFGFTFLKQKNFSIDNILFSKPGKLPSSLTGSNEILDKCIISFLQ